MPKLKPDTQRARREHILDAAERRFARSGFHRTTMQDICKEAAVSPGALYLYFDSKEALIAGISERDRAEFAERFAGLATAPDFLEALQKLGSDYFEDEPPHKRIMCIEIGLESIRNPRIGEIQRSVDTFITDSFASLFQRLKDEGRIAPKLEIAALVQIFTIIGDGLFWQRAINPEFDPKVSLGAALTAFASLLGPVEPPDGISAPASPQSDEAAR